MHFNLPETVNLINEKSLCYFVFPSFQSFPLRHAIFTRLGGYSEGPYHSLNVSQDVGDRICCVDKNLQKIKTFLGADCLVWAKQAHGKRVLIIKDKRKLNKSYIGFDALVTDQPRVALLVKLADCQAIFLYDSFRKVIANIHCGWRGNILDIIGITIKAMIMEFDTSPSDLWAAISPSLGPCCSEFKDYQKQLPESFWAYQIKPNYFNFWKISINQLINAGVPHSQIILANICSACLPLFFFSYRRDKRTGRFGAIIMLKDTF